MNRQLPTIDEALRAVRVAYRQVVDGSGDQEDRATEDALMRRLATRLRFDPDGTVPLDDGSLILIGPERGDRGEETGRIGVVQRFPDGRPERVHLVTL